ncbi:Beta-glucan synthesis-associated protein (SKN1) domain containing protein [Elaphomyces granulatus]
MTPSRSTPHLRLNSGRDNPFVDLEDGPNPVRQQLPTRSLIPPTLIDPSSQSKGAQGSPYSPTPTDFSDHLLPPPTRHRWRDDNDSVRSPDQSALSSRRNSFDSDVGSRDSRGFPYDPFADSRAPSRAGSDDDNVNTQTVAEKYNIMPTEGLLLFPEDVEKDDYLHNPDPNDKDRDCDVCNTRGVINVGGLILLTLGILSLFIAYPVATFVRKLTEPSSNNCGKDPMCLGVGNVPLLKNIRTALIDPDTPDSAKTITSANGKQWQLVFSDEFNTAGRSFYNNDDPFFQAVNIWYGVTQDIEWYDPDAITTRNGVLEIRFDAFQNHEVNYRSGMLQSWNQMCFKGGRLEASISLPGRGDTSGFWPGFWTMGNLGRPGYAATSEGMWPYSYEDVCDVGVTANQSSPDGISYLPGMRLPACTCQGEDHPTPGKSRGAPEIDVIEASVHLFDLEKGFQLGDVSQSMQVAPFDIWYLPNYDFIAVYDSQISGMNSYRGGPYQQAISGVTNLNNKWYNGKEYQVYAFEYTPGATGDVTWFVGSQKTWTLDGRAVGPNGNVGQRVIPVEPMAIVLNFGMSASFAPLNFTGLAPLLPATMQVDYIRIYQDPDSVSVTCDPPGYETTSYINNHPEPYANPNLTTWEPTYKWPKNSLVNGCKS